MGSAPSGYIQCLGSEGDGACCLKRDLCVSRVLLVGPHMPRWRKAAPATSRGPHILLEGMTAAAGRRKGESLLSVCKACPACVPALIQPWTSQSAGAFCFVEVNRPTRPANTTRKSERKENASHSAWRSMLEFRSVGKAASHWARRAALALTRLVGHPMLFSWCLGLTQGRQALLWSPSRGSRLARFAHTALLPASDRQAPNPPAPFFRFQTKQPGAGVGDMHLAG